MSRVSYLCLFLTSQVLCLSYFSYDITKEDGEKVVHWLHGTLRPLRVASPTHPPTHHGGIYLNVLLVW